MRIASISLGALLFLSAGAHGHGVGVANIGAQSLAWRTEQISRVIAQSSGHDIGRVVTLDGKQCLEGTGFVFDVNDRFAFDIDETVHVEVELYRQAQRITPELSYEKNGEAQATVQAELPAIEGASRTHKATFTLARARFANHGLYLTDFSMGLGGNSFGGKQKITICNVSLKRSHATVVPKDFGNIMLQVADETGKAVPARVGIYDQQGRLPLPSEEAVAVKRFDEMTRVVNLTPERIPWPVRNQTGFYVDGSYRAKLPVGQYELVVARGPEYRFIRQTFNVGSDQTQTIKINLKRWDNLPAKGWYSGDNHIHYIRHSQSDDPNLLLFTQAEDVHVANILQMGNIVVAAWPQYGWSPVSAVTDKTYSFVPGQEDPRTSRRGHTISLNLKEPIRDPQHYLLYHNVFKKAHAQGGVTGYAHVVGEGIANSRGGLALDVPFGLVDFAEVMQFGFAGTSVWFDFLNLGYKLAPSAGTDYMLDVGIVGSLPGAERSYVYVPKPFSLQGWFNGLKRGETFVTSGPMLEFTVNGQRMGSELRLKSGDKLVIEATASINPDVDSLARLELIEQGEVIKTVKARGSGVTKLQLRHQTTAQHGTWFVVRAGGSQPHRPKNPMPGWESKQGSAKIALSGAVYVYVDGQSFWKPSAVRSIVQRLKANMEKFMMPETGETEEWGTREVTLKFWDSQKGLLKQRIDEVIPIYDRLVTEAKAAIEKRRAVSARNGQ